MDQGKQTFSMVSDGYLVFVTLSFLFTDDFVAENIDFGIQGLCIYIAFSSNPVRTE